MCNNRFFKCNFNGRLNGAIGITYPNTETVEAITADDAKKKLYEKYEHISKLSIQEL